MSPEALDHAAAEARLARHFAGPPLSPAEVRALRAHLRTCAACRAAYDALAETERALALGATAPDPEAAALLAAGLSPTGVARFVAAGLDLPASAPAPARRRRRWLSLGLPLGLAAALAAGLAVWLGGRSAAPPDPGDAPVARGGGSGAPRLRIFAAPAGPDAAPTPASDRLDPGAGVLFSYSNPADSPARWLAVVGRDGAGDILWFAPVWASAEDRPQSLPIAAGVADREVPRIAFVAAAPGPLEICGWFTAAPVSIAAADAALAAAWPPAGQRDCHRFEVPR